jgi:NADPH:quinone reductase-like Zn-dependent oxidoreductase
LRAARIHQYGPPDVLQIEDVPTQKLRPYDVLIEVHAASVNPVDCKIRSGGQRGIIRYRLPVTLGLDVAGVVVERGTKAQKFEIGDAVFGTPTHRRDGSYAEYLVVDQQELAPKPKTVTFNQAASIPLVGLTAYQALIEKGKVQSGQTILILAGSGGVGTIAIQIAKHLGMNVIATCSGRNTDLVTSLGADRVIDYTKEDFTTVLSDIDFVLDSLGGDARYQALRVLKKGGVVLGIVSNLPDFSDRYGPNLGVAAALADTLKFATKAKFAQNVRYAFIVRNTNQKHLEALSALVDEGAIAPVIDKVFPLDEIVEAHRYSESGRARGKIVIEVRPEPG